MRTRQGIPNDPGRREVWLTMAELKNELPQAAQVEFASYLLSSALETEELEATESADSLLALAHALDVLSAEGW